MVLISSNSICFGKLKINKLKLLKNELKLQHSLLLTTHDAIAIASIHISCAFVILYSLVRNRHSTSTAGKWRMVNAPEFLFILYGLFKMKSRAGIGKSFNFERWGNTNLHLNTSIHYDKSYPEWEWDVIQLSRF